MKKLIFILIAISFILFGCENPTNIDDSVDSTTVTTVEETPVEETPTDTEPTTPTTITPTEPTETQPTDTQETETDKEESTETDTNNGEEVVDTNVTDETETETSTNNNEETETVEQTNPSVDEPVVDNSTDETSEETTTEEPTNNDIGNNEGNNDVVEDNPSGNEDPIDNPDEPPIEEPEIIKPNLSFADSNVNTCDSDYVFNFTVTNYSHDKINLYYTCDGTDPSVISGLQTRNTNTYYGHFENNLLRNVPNTATTVTVKAIAYYNDRVDGKPVHIASDIIEKTYTLNQYTITFQSDLPYSSLPENMSMKKGTYTFGNIGQYYPDVRGYWFSHFEVNGETKNIGDSVVISSNSTIKYCWVEWEFPWYDESEVPSGFTKISSDYFDDVDSSKYYAYRVTVNNYIYTFKIDKSKIRKVTYKGKTYVSFTNGSLTKHELRGGTMRQLASYSVSYGENTNNLKLCIYDYSGHEYNTTMYTNLNDTDYFSYTNEIYFNLSDFAKITF